MVRIRELRQEKGLTMKQLGEAVGVTESAIGQYETGRRKPDYEKLLCIAKVLGCSIDDLVVGETDYENFAAALARLRNERGLSYAELADELSRFLGSTIRPASVRNWESGASRISENGMRKIASFFGVPFEEMISADGRAQTGIKTPGVKTDAGVIGDLELAVAQADDRTRALIKRILGYSDSQVSAFLLLTQSLPNEQDAPGDPK